MAPVALLLGVWVWVFRRELGMLLASYRHLKSRRLALPPQTPPPASGEPFVTDALAEAQQATVH